jgi:superfamily II DNA or RNA helicase
MAMVQESKGGDLFVVDNSDEGWTGLRYLQEWTEIAKSFDIATGFFEIGSLLDLDGRWQQLDKIRILMGAEMTHRTRRALNEAVRARAASSLDSSLEAEKELNPFLNGVPAILAALESGKIDCRIYDRTKFHSKAYITHAKLDVVGAKALVGSSNFTRPGLTKNVELNIQVQSPGDVAQLQEWFDNHWADAIDVTDEILARIRRHARPFTPFEVYAKALQEFFEGHELTASEWEQSGSHMFPVLDRYQQEAYWGLLQIARRHGGAFLCDGVGLGKTFVGLMLIERFVMLEGKRVVLLAPKGAKEAVWEKDLREYLPTIGGAGASVDFSNLTVFSHTDLNRGGDFPERFARVAELADVVIIDEAHHFRNPGRRGSPENSTDDSRYYKLYDLLDPGVRPKQVFMLTATPVNNRLVDFRHMVQLFSRRQENYFAQTLGVNNLTAHFSALEKTLTDRLGLERTDLTDNLVEASETLSRDETFRALVVQRSRAYAKASQIQEKGKSAVFPERGSPKVADYSIRKTYGNLLDMMEKAFQKENPLFALPVYYPLAYYKGADEDIDAFTENRQRQVVGLIRTQFLKRFESSVYAFDTSCYRLMQKLLAFLEKNSESDREKKRLEKWRRMNEEVLHFAVDRQMLLWGEEPNAGNDEDDDMVPTEFLELFETLPRDEYDVDQIMDETYSDLEQLVRFLQETRKFEPKHDDKLNKLKRLLKSKDIGDEKVLIFTEFADTARYLLAQLEEAEFQDVEQVDSGRALGKKSRADVIERFSPYYNRTTSSELAKDARKEIRVLISTDILSEGLNLQDAD